MHKARGRMYLFVGTFGLWVLVTSSLHWQELALGGVVAAIVAIAVGEVASFFGGLRSPLAVVVATPAYLVRFIWKLIVANIDVARRVLSPQVPVQPGIVAVQTNIRSDLGRLLLANSITLTPGTLTLDGSSVSGDGTALLYVHWIDTPPKGTVGEEIAGTFEKGLKRIVE